MLYKVYNPIAYIISSLAPEVTTSFLKLEIETFAYSNVWEEIDILDCVPTDGVAIFYLQEFLKERLSYDLPNFNGSGVIFCQQVCKRFRVSTASMEANDVFEDLVFTLDNTEFFAILGGFAIDEYPNRGSNLLPNDARFLTRTPRQLLDRDQKAFLYYLPYANYTALQAIFTLLYEDNTTEVIALDLGNLLKYQPIIIPVGFAARNYQLVNISKSIVEITVTIANKTYKFETIQNADLQSVREIYFANSLGGFDAVSCTGVFTEELTSEHSPFEHYLPYNYTNNSRQIKSYNHITQGKGKIRSGFMPKEIYQPIIKDLLASREVFLREGNTFLPIRITSKKQDLFSSDSYLYGFDVEFEYCNKIVN